MYHDDVFSHMIHEVPGDIMNKLQMDIGLILHPMGFNPCKDLFNENK